MAASSEQKCITMLIAEFMKFVKCENEDVFDIKRMYRAGFQENVKLS
ncbi:Protein of unknown function [Bacillus wiedmannii]|nr:Protein of unknown function [Bacillus wiedmannii]